MKIIATAPTRLSLFGGGTDLPVYSEKYGGICVNMAINLRQKFEIYFNGMGIHNIERGATEMFTDTFFEIMGVKEPYDLHQTFNAPIESGLGSSASAAVALIGAINKAKNLGMTKHEIAEKAWDIEVNKLGLYGGRQDQYAAVYGGVNFMEFGDAVKVTPIRGDVENLLNGLILFYTGKNRKSAKIQEGFKKLSKEQIKSLDAMKDIAKQAIGPVKQGKIEAVGRLLDITWKHKKDSNKGVTNKRINKIYSDAKRAGALGGKICGAGGGGHMILMCLPENREKVIKSIETNGAKEVDFSIDWNGLEVRKL